MKFPGGPVVKTPPPMQEVQIQPLGSIWRAKIPQHGQSISTSNSQKVTHHLPLTIKLVPHLLTAPEAQETPAFSSASKLTTSWTSLVVRGPCSIPVRELDHTSWKINKHTLKKIISSLLPQPKFFITKGTPPLWEPQAFKRSFPPHPSLAQKLLTWLADKKWQSFS